jgi:hypothetical protein
MELPPRELADVDRELERVRVIESEKATMNEAAARGSQGARS